MNKKFVYHRALNSEIAFENFIKNNQGSDYSLAAEGDICWAYIDKQFVIYIHHPDIHGKSLSNERIIQLLASNELFTLDKLFNINSKINFILELKTGNGVLKDFFLAFRDTLQRHDVKNVLIDAFSINQLKEFKEIAPSIKTSLHTKLIINRYVFETTFEKPYFRIHNLYHLDFINYITISYTTTSTNLLKLNIDKSYKHVYKSNKNLNLGSIKSINTFKKAIQSKVEYIYLRSSEVLEHYEEVLASLNKS